MNNTKSAFIISVGLVVSAIIFGIFFYNARQKEQTVRVVGYATEDFEADIIKWSFTLSVTTPLNKTTEGYETLNQKVKIFRELWKKKNIQTQEMNFQPVTINKQFGQYRKITGNILQQKIFIISKEIDKIENIVINPLEFAKKGLGFEYSNVEYFSSELPKLKKKLLSAATKNAMERAEEIVQSTGNKIDKLISARAGVFQITEPFSTDVAGYGIYQTSTRKKTIKVTVTAVFSLK